MTFTPVPFTLLRVCAAWEVPFRQFIPAELYDIREFCHPDHGEPWALQFFDPWRRGDLIVAPRHHSHFEYGNGTRTWTTYEVARRHTTPSVRCRKIAFGDGDIRQQPNPIYRIAWHYLGAAEHLLGIAFETLGALETALAGDAALTRHATSSYMTPPNPGQETHADCGDRGPTAQRDCA